MRLTTFTLGIAAILASCNGAPKQTGRASPDSKTISTGRPEAKQAPKGGNFTTQLGKLRVGMSESAVEDLLGEPDSEWTAERHQGTWLRDTSKVWDYGTSDLGPAKRGSVYFDREHRVARAYGSVTQLLGPERATQKHFPMCLPLVNGCGCAHACATSVSANPDGTCEVVYWGTDSATIKARMERWCFDEMTCMDAFRDQTPCGGECIPSDEFNNCHIEEGSCVP